MRYLLTILLTILYLYLPAQQSTFLRATTATSGGGGTTGILDSYTGAAAAYATALLYSGYSGSCLRVRRDSDNTEQDIGFSGQDIDEAAINSFCSGANCYVKTWYDQSGSGNNATQTTLSNQPKIYDSATGIVYENSVAAIKYDQLTEKSLNAHNIYSHSGVLTSWTIATPVSNTVNNTYLAHTSTAAPYVFERFRSNGFLVTYREPPNPGEFLSFDSYSSATQYLVYAIHPTGTGNTVMGLNGSTNTPASASNSITYTGVTIGNRFGASGFGLNGTMQAVIVYQSDQSANRAAIETAINNYYNIYP